MCNKANFLFILIGLIPFTLFSQQTIMQNLDSIKLIKPGASLVTVSKQFSFTEGPAVDKNGNVFFTDQPNDKIWKYDTEGNLSVFMDKAGRSNGMSFDKKGRLISCADEKNQLWTISPNGTVEVLLTNFNGHLFNGPNDLWIDKTGAFILQTLITSVIIGNEKSPT